ncbi:hypothetical protein HK100_001102 [Physocladia obscura]|uniref:Ribosomal protein bL31m N-terminal domain-containing protein n=1 Tax=Physocladia obscura TaxID=109957 RepID=A0AAD5SZ19_9FUNG|nr:hypothetical protein HK100_001102 [Physocladia obscura]
MARTVRVLTLAAIPKAASPHFFFQKVVHSDGSTFTMRCTTPKAVLKLTKDTRNHMLWNPSFITIDDRTGELSKFASRFGDLSSFDEFVSGDTPIVLTKKAAPPPVFVVPAASGGKKKK